MQDVQFWNDVWTSTAEFMVGFAFAVLAGIAFGLIIGWYRRPRLLFDPWLMAFNSLPRLALLPLVVLWVGLGFWSTIVIVFLGVFFPMALNTFHGVRTVERKYLEVASTFGASQRQRFGSVIVPSVLPFITTGARIGVGRGVAGVAVGEFYSANAGLADRIFEAGLAYEIDSVIFGTVFITLMAVGAYRLVALVDTRVAARGGTFKTAQGDG